MKPQYTAYVIGFVMGALLFSISTALQPRNIHHNITITQPLQVEFAALEECMVGKCPEESK